MNYTEFKNHQVTTAKKHECAWCGECIPPKSSSQYRAYLFDGDFHSDWMHPECYLAMESSDESFLDEGFSPGDNKRGEAIADD
jgi:hypothetical protein